MECAIVSAADVEFTTKSPINGDGSFVSPNRFGVAPAEMQYVPTGSHAESTGSVIVDVFRQSLRGPRQS